MISELMGPYADSWASFSNGGIKPPTLILGKGSMGHQLDWAIAYPES